MHHPRLLLARTKRSLFGSAALVCFAAAFVLEPSDVRSQLDLRPRELAPASAPAAEAPLVPIAPGRDAFAPRAESGDDAPLPNPVPGVPRLPRLPLPAPASARLASSLTPTVRTRVTAIATGAHATAIVETGGAERIVQVGDTLDGSPIASIDDDAIRLRDGRRLSLQPASEMP